MARYDKSTPDRRIIKLTRAGHYLWSLRRKSATTGNERQAIDEALETIWAAKQQVKELIEQEKKASWAAAKAHFARA